VDVWQTSTLRRLRLGEEIKNEEEEERTNHSMKIYMVCPVHRATINKPQHENIYDLPYYIGRP